MWLLANILASADGEHCVIISEFLMISVPEGLSTSVHFRVLSLPQVILEPIL